MEKWEIALQKFLKKWVNKKEVIGVVVCGSYITGNPSKHSDIDVHIILNSKTSWRERGNEIVDGILIEYFANPIQKHYDYSLDDFKRRRRMNAHMFSTGKILFDKTGQIKKLVRDSKKNLMQKFQKQDKIQTELAKYGVWDTCDNLEEVFEANGKEFFFVYYASLHSLYEIYSKFLQFESIPAHKIKRLLIDEKDKKKYLIGNFPDSKFVKMYINAINIKNKSKMMSEYKKLTKHILTKMGGFNIDGWKIKSPAK